MKQKAGPAIIIAAVVVLAALMFVMYKVAFQPQSPEPSAANAPAYAKQMTGSPAAANPGGSPAGNPAAGGTPDYSQTYQKGSQYKNAPGPSNRTP